MRTTLLRVEVNGSMATAGLLQHLALVNYGHFTAMQVRGGRTRGLDLHLRRLDVATRELFGTGLDADRIRGHIRHAIADVRDASVRIDATAIPVGPALMKTLSGIYEFVPWDLI